jgi:hypothetical protein
LKAARLRPCALLVIARTCVGERTSASRALGIEMVHGQKLSDNTQRGSDIPVNGQSGRLSTGLLRATQIVRWSYKYLLHGGMLRFSPLWCRSIEWCLCYVGMAKTKNIFYHIIPGFTNIVISGIWWVQNKGVLPVSIGLIFVRNF